MPAYVPPHLRNRQQASETDSLDVNISSQSSRSSAHERLQSYRGSYDTDLLSAEEIRAHFWKDADVPSEATTAKTLNASTEHPNGLAWVLVYIGGNPKWDSDQNIFVKSNLQLLPAIEGYNEGHHDHLKEGNKSEMDEGIEVVNDSERNNTPATSSRKKGSFDSSVLSQEPSKFGKPAQHSPFAVFAQAFQQKGVRTFKFLGWFKVKHLELFALRSQALIDMLMNKWGKLDKSGRLHHKERGAAAWEASLQHEWAAIMVERDEEAEKTLGKPKIDKIEKDDSSGGQPGRSVNEMLAEMRLRDGSKGVNIG